MPEEAVHDGPWDTVELQELIGVMLTRKSTPSQIRTLQNPIEIPVQRIPQGHVSSSTSNPTITEVDDNDDEHEKPAILLTR